MLHFKLETAEPYLLQIDAKANSLNRGRALGLYLWEQRARCPVVYCYLSAHHNAFGEPLGEFDNNYVPFLFAKTSLVPRDFPSRMLKVLDLWVNLVNGAP